MRPHGIKAWIDDFRWAMRAMRCRQYRRFDEALRPRTSDNAIIAYPDAFYHVSSGDFYVARSAASIEVASREDVHRWSGFSTMIHRNGLIMTIGMAGIACGVFWYWVGHWIGVW